MSASTIDDSVISEIKSKVRPSDLIGQFVTLKRSGKEYVGLSPFSKEKTPSFTVNDDKGFYHCFSSGKHGDVIDFLVESQGMAWRDAVEKLATDTGTPLAPAKPAPKPTIVCHYDYEDQTGKPYLRVTRLSDKSFRQSHWNDIDECWQSGKPSGPTIPYRLPDILTAPDQIIHLVEGEKAADYLAGQGLLATTAPGGGTAFPLADDFAVWFDGQRVRAYPDNDATGRKWAERVAQRLPHAEIVWLPDQAPKAGADDWLQREGKTVDDLIGAVSVSSDEFVHESTTLPTTPISRIAATPFEWIDPSLIPPREWLYDAHLIRKFVSMTVSPGGLGKSSLALIDAMSMASGRALFADSVIHEPDPLRVWYWNGEDPNEETRRRVVAAALHYNLKPADFASRLFTDSGREQALILGSMVKGEIDLNEDFFTDLEGEIIANRIDVLIIDPFVSAHRMGENDNNAIDAILKRLGKLAERCNCAVEIIHHVRKPSQGSTAKTEVHDARGASALIGGVRSARVLNVMDDKIADAAFIARDLRERYFSVIDGKANMSLKDPNGRWRFLESVCLGNQTETRKADNVGVVTYYKLPDAARLVEDLSSAEDEMRLILSQDDTCRHWGGKNKKPANWLGHRIMDALNLHDNEHEDAMQKLIVGWLQDGSIIKRSVTEGGNRVTFLTLAIQPFSAPQTPDISDGDVPF